MMSAEKPYVTGWWRGEYYVLQFICLAVEIPQIIDLYWIEEVMLHEEESSNTSTAV